MAALLSGADPAGIAATCAKLQLEPREFAALAATASAYKAAAYCPYSRFCVGCAVLPGIAPSSALSAPTASAAEPLPAAVTVLGGANVENAAYPTGVCAERVALARAVVDGFRGFRAIAVATDITPPASPCGMCRQFIREFCGPQTPVIMFDKHGDYCYMLLEQLLPNSFGPESLSHGSVGPAPGDQPSNALPGTSSSLPSVA